MALYLRNLRRKGSGNYMKGRAGQAIGSKKLVYRTAAGNWQLADADAAATMPVVGISMGPVNAGQIVDVLLEGFIGSMPWTWTSGGEIYASTVAGELTQTAPVPPDLAQVVGVAITSDMIYFNSLPPSAGLSGSIVKEEFYPPVESDAYVGQHFGAQMLDNMDTIVGFEFTVPNDYHTLDSVYVMVVQTAAAAPNMVWSATTDFALACSTENYDVNQDATGLQTSQVLQNDVVCLDVSDALTGIAAEDLVGMEFLRDGDNVADTVGSTVFCLGLRLRYR